MSKSILVTGGAGFIGSYVCDALLAQGHRVRVLDNLSPQVHGEAGEQGEWPAYLDEDVERLHGDVRDPETVAVALRGCHAVYHLAAMVGVGQSMYEIARYTQVNNVGTAVLLEALIQQPVERLIVASSMSLYGEGLYRSARSNGQVHLHQGAGRTMEQMKHKHWEPTDENGGELIPLPTPESKQPDLASIYALSKFDQERMCLIAGKAYNIPTVALRFFNVYGPRQALSNPYTGVLAIFASRLLNGKPPLIFEDGQQQRDFVSVHDVARACTLALEAPEAAGLAINVGSGQHYTIAELARKLAQVMDQASIEAQITGDYRVGDIRHCFADISLARRVLGYEPQVTLEAGMAELAQWLRGQAADDRVDEARAELATRGLTV